MQRFLPIGASTTFFLTVMVQTVTQVAAVGSPAQPVAQTIAQTNSQPAQSVQTVQTEAAQPPIKLTPRNAPGLPDLPGLQPTLPETTEVRLLLKLKERRVYVYQGEAVKASYPVAVGRAGWETPTGEFQVFSMLRNPGWTNPFTGEVLPPGADNPLGERWIAFWTDGQNDVGFHGTPNRETVGQAASHGCVRMLNEDIRELFEFVKPGTRVTVVP